ncbi:MAG: hypothetical protein ACI32E_03960 [Bacilli bacterium]
MTTSNQNIDSMRQDKDQLLQKGESSLADMQYKNAIKYLNKALECAKNIYHSSLSTSDYGEIITIYALLGQASEKQYLKNNDIVYLDKAKDYYRHAIKILNKIKNKNIVNKQDSLKYCLKLAEFNDRSMTNTEYLEIKNNLKNGKDVIKKLKTTESYFSYWLLVLYYANSLYREKHYTKAYKLYTSCADGFYKLYKIIHSKECEDYLNSIYSSIVEISKIKKWKKSIVKYGNKLYELNN